MKKTISFITILISATLIGNAQSDTGEEIQGSSSSDDLKTYSKYDFVPGEQVIYFDDFSQDAIGDFPDKWNTSSGGEVVTIGKQTNKWLKCAQSASYSPELKNAFPDNFTIEYDLLLRQTEDKGEPVFAFQIYSGENEDMVSAIAGGYTVICKLSGCENIVENMISDQPDVMLMDIEMPGINGIEGTRLLKSAFPGINIIMLTVQEEDQKIFDSICAGASGYLLKKTPPYKILEAITDIYHGGSPMTGKIARKVLQFFQDRNKPRSNNFGLTKRESEILSHLVQGDTYSMIADQCFISISTVQSHITKIYEKLHVHSKAEAVAKALNSGIV